MTGGALRRLLQLRQAAAAELEWLRLCRAVEEEVGDVVPVIPALGPALRQRMFVTLAVVLAAVVAGCAILVVVFWF